LEVKSMKIIALVMVLAGFTIGAGAALEFRYYGPEATQFWVAVFATPAGFFFALVGVLLWWRGPGVRRLVMLAGLIMATATIAATALGVMGPPATIVGLASALTALAWSWKTGALAPGA
jgi:hypothetical protein